MLLRQIRNGLDLLLADVKQVLRLLTRLVKVDLHGSQKRAHHRLRFCLIALVLGRKSLGNFLVDTLRARR